MTNMTPSTGSEKKLMKSIQAKIGAAQDGIIGPASAVYLSVARMRRSCLTKRRRKGRPSRSEVPESEVPEPEVPEPDMPEAME